MLIKEDAMYERARARDGEWHMRVHVPARRTFARYLVRIIQ